MSRSFFDRFPEYQISHEEGIERFLNRVNDFIFCDLRSKYGYDDNFRRICKHLGARASDYGISNFGVGHNYASLEKLTQRKLGRTMPVLEFLSPEYNEEIKEILLKSTEIDEIDLGIRFHNGIFYKAGDDELDESIINRSLDSIDEYQKIKGHWVSAIKLYSSGNYASALTECYTTIEKLAQEVLGNTKALGKNQNDLIKFLKSNEEHIFNKQWREIIKYLCIYLHDYSSRHGSKIDDIDVIEVDGTMYLVGNIINLVSKKDILNKNK